MLRHDNAAYDETALLIENESTDGRTDVRSHNNRDRVERICAEANHIGKFSGSRAHLFIDENGIGSRRVGWFTQGLGQWFFPPDVPRSLHVLRIENVAVPACYLIVGLMQGLSRPLLNVYPLDLGTSEAQQVTLATLTSLPGIFKVFFGFLSDNVPLFGYRRKLYMAIGWFFSTCSMAVLMLSSDLTMDRYGAAQADGSNRLYLTPPEGAPSASLLGVCFLMLGTGIWFADVMGDSIVAEKAKLEPENVRGHLQSTCYACRFFGTMVAAPLSTVCYSSYGPVTVVSALAIIPLFIQPLIYCFREEKCAIRKGTDKSCAEIWDTVCSRAAWQPLGFIWIYNILQVSNGAWRQFLKSALGFSENQINSLLISSYVLLYLGTLAYKYYFVKWGWRKVYIAGILLNGFFSGLQILLILGTTFGLSPFLFALGDDAFSELIVGIQFLPITIMLVHLCPDGSEGASYALFTSVHNSAIMMAPAISTTLLSIWDVSKEAITSGDLSGMVKLTCLTSLIQFSAILFVKLLPQDRYELDCLKNVNMRSGIGGFVILTMVFVSMSYSVVVGILNIAKPGWAGES